MWHFLNRNEGDTGRVSFGKQGRLMDGYTEYGYRGLEEIKKLQSEISELKKQIADENIKVA